jgi:predicted DNA binding CopG/RHH family protein
METKKPIPKFASETEEARWWDEHRDDLDEYMSEPAPEAQVRLDSLVATLPPRPAKKSKVISLNISESLIDRARRAAGRKGIGYQTYLKLLIADGLEREERTQA